MKEKIKELFKNGWIGIVVALVITILLMSEEKSLGDMTNAWLLGLAVSAIAGMLAEVFRYVSSGGKYQWKNLLWWLAGAVIGVVAMLVV